MVLIRSYEAKKISHRLGGDGGIDLLTNNDPRAVSRSELQFTRWSSWGLWRKATESIF
jgi:hypothetical protein